MILVGKSHFELMSFRFLNESFKREFKAMWEKVVRKEQQPPLQRQGQQGVEGVVK